MHSPIRLHGVVLRKTQRQRYHAFSRKVFQLCMLWDDAPRLRPNTSNSATVHAVAQAVSRRLPTAAAWVVSCEILGGQSGTGAGFLRALRLPLRSIPPIAPDSSSSIIRGWYNRPVVASVMVNSVPLHTRKKKSFAVNYQPFDLHTIFITLLIK
jgi:hypothetical protein